MNIEQLSPEQQEVQNRIEDSARRLAQSIDVVLNPYLEFSGERNIGFALLVFSFGDQPQPATWISNSQREDMIFAVEEWLNVMKSRH